LKPTKSEQIGVINEFRCAHSSIILHDVGRNEYRIFNHKRHRSHKRKLNLNENGFVDFELFVVNLKNPSTTHRKALYQTTPIDQIRSYIQPEQDNPIIRP